MVSGNLTNEILSSLSIQSEVLMKNDAQAVLIIFGNEKDHLDKSHVLCFSRGDCRTVTSVKWLHK